MKTQFSSINASIREFVQWMLIILAVMGNAGRAIPQDTNQAGTNQVLSQSATTNSVQPTSDAELQEAARQVWHKLIAYAALGLIGVVVVAGFALYGAYKKFGVVGVVVVGVIIAVGICAILGLLLVF